MTRRTFLKGAGIALLVPRMESFGTTTQPHFLIRFSGLGGTPALVFTSSIQFFEASLKQI